MEDSRQASIRKNKSKPKYLLSIFVIASVALVIVSLLVAAWHYNALANQSSKHKYNLENTKAPIEKIAFCCRNPTDPFFQKIILGAAMEQKNMPYELEWKFGSSTLFDNSQAAVLRSYLREKGINALVLTPIPGQSQLAPVLQQLQKKDPSLPIITVDAAINKNTIKNYNLNIWEVQINQANAAGKAASFLAKNIKETGKVILIGGDASHKHAQQRVKGVTQSLKNYPNIEIIKTVWCNWSNIQAYNQMNTLLALHPDVKGIICSNDRMALGAIRALKKAKLKGVKVVGFDGLSEALQAIKNGDLLATVDQNPTQQGLLGIRIARQLLEGKKINRFIEVPSKLIEKNKLLSTSTQEVK